MKKPSKRLAFLILLVSPFFIAATSAPKYQENTRINNEVVQLIDSGVFPTWHSEYLSNSYYHKLYLKYKVTPSGLTYFAAMSRATLEQVISNYVNSDKNFHEIISNLSVPVTKLPINQSIGITYTGQTLQLIWSSEYIPHERLNLKSVTVNNTTINQGKIIIPACPFLDGDGIFENTFSYNYPEYNVQVNMTPIGGYVYCSNGGYYKYGIDVEQTTFAVSRWSAGMDPLLPEEAPDPTGYYNFQCEDPVTFNLSKKPVINGTHVSQVVSHRYIEIKEIDAQSTYDPIFGGYKHHVFFNLPVPVDQVYRVDCNYTLTNDNKDWWQIWLNGEATHTVVKSLNAEKKQGGLFNLFSYSGLTEGKYASNVNQKIFYKYKLHLNYDSSWRFLNIGALGVNENNFKRIQAFNIFRINYVTREKKSRLKSRWTQSRATHYPSLTEN